MQPDITISIVNTNNRDITLQCIESIYLNQDELRLEVIVINNACVDGSTPAIRNRYPKVNVIENEQMLGFSTNNNLAIGQAAGRYIMLLNDDTIVQQRGLQEMVAFLDSHPKAGIAGACLLNLDGSFQYCYDYTPGPLYEGLRPFSEFFLRFLKSSDTPLKVGNVSGAAIMVRASAINTIGGLDTRFDPLYSEEIDWCYRFEKAGWEIFHLPKAKIIHLGEVAQRRSSPERYTRIYQKKAVFINKHYGPVGLFVYQFAFIVSNLLKTGYWITKWAFKNEIASNEIRIHWVVIRNIF